MKAKRKEQNEAAHDVAMFGASVIMPSETPEAEAEAEAEKKDSNGSDLATSLLSEKVRMLYSFISFQRERDREFEHFCCHGFLFRYLQNNKVHGVTVLVAKGTDRDTSRPKFTAIKEGL